MFAALAPDWTGPSQAAQRDSVFFLFHSIRRDCAESWFLKDWKRATPLENLCLSDWCPGATWMTHLQLFIGYELKYHRLHPVWRRRWAYRCNRVSTYIYSEISSLGWRRRSLRDSVGGGARAGEGHGWCISDVPEMLGSISSSMPKQFAAMLIVYSVINSHQVWFEFFLQAFEPNVTLGVTTISIEFQRFSIQAIPSRQAAIKRDYGVKALRYRPIHPEFGGLARCWVSACQRFHLRFESDWI